MGAFNPDANCTIPDDLVAFWRLEEASGTRVDSFGSNDLTDNNTVTQAVGIVGNAAQFTAANAESLSIADNADLSMGDIDFSLASWVYMDSKPGGNHMHIMFKGAIGTSADEEYRLFWSTSTDRFECEISDGTTRKLLSASSFGAPSTGEWHLVLYWHDATANTVNIQINNGTVDSAAWTTGAQDTTNSFFMGVLGTDASAYWDGRIDETGIWKGVLTSQERTDLYNAGAGNTFDPSGTCPATKTHFFMMFD